MKAHPPERIRNVVVVGHQGSGKTTLVEAMLLRAGVISRVGRVEDGTATTDFEPEEQAHHQSLSLALAPFEWEGHKLNVIDTPGYADFIAEVHAALRVADLAVFVVSAVDGVEVQTEIIWRLAAERNLPRMIFVNKLDRENASFERVLDELRERFGAGIAPLELPVGVQASFRGVADLLGDKAYLYESGSATEAPIPADMADLEQRVRDNLIEGIVVADDDLLERYLEGEVPGTEELEKTLARGVASAQVFPVVCGSATIPIGVDRLCTLICHLGPSPLDRPPVTATGPDGPVELRADPAGPPVAFVFKTFADPYVGRISLFRVISGTIRPDDVLHNPRTGADERLHGLFTLRGKEQITVPELPAGDIGAVAKLSDTATGDTLAPRDLPVRLPPVEMPPPLMAVAVAARTQADEDKLSQALHRISEEDPAIVVDRDPDTGQTLLRGVGDSHINITLERMRRKFGVEVETSEPRVPYRETITRTAEAEGKHKKQTGGHGQFGVAWVRLEPLERGAGYEFVDQIVGGVIPRQYIPSVDKGIQEAMQRGGRYGYPVVDVRAVLYDGKHHPVDSSEMSFKMAGSLAFRAAFEQAAPVVLEPISHLRVTVPTDLQGDVMGDLNARRGRVQGTEPGDGPDEVTIDALVPTAEIQRYAIDLRSITGGRGRFTVEHSHYDVMPPNLAERLEPADAAS